MALRFVIPGLGSAARSLRRADDRLARGDRAGALKAWAQAADRGSHIAAHRLGRIYLEGAGVPVSVAEGMRWLEQAASTGHVESQALLAAMMLRGLAAASEMAPAAGLFTANATGEPDFTSARAWAQRAADAGSADGQAVLAYILTSGPAEMRDPGEARRLYQLSAGAGCPQGALGYALMLAAEAKDQKSAHRQVVHWLAVAAKAGLPTARFMLAEARERGLGCPIDLEAAAELYRQAAEQGQRSAQARYGAALMQGRGVKQNAGNAESWLRRAALAGDPDAAAVVGDLYAKGGAQGGGHGGANLPPNFLEAALWYRRAADAGHRTAARALGMLYLTGAGVPRDREEAARWFRLSAERGDAAALADLGNLTLGGGVPEDQASEDLVRTRKMFAAAAEKGDAVAAFNLAVCLAEGVGTERDPVQAAHWMRRAAETLANAQFWYGRMLAEGRGVTPDPGEARIWLARATESGMVDAVVLLAEMLVNGRGGAKDHLAAQGLFGRAAEKGHVGAMFALGALSGGGHDVPVDRTVARRWFLAAAERGHPQSQLMLGRYMARGLGGDADLAAARAWLEKARGHGLDAAADLAALPMSPEPPPATPLSAHG